MSQNQYRLRRAMYAGADEPKVILFDLWKTLARATYPEPVAFLQKLLGYDCPTGDIPPVVNKQFLEACLETPNENPDEFVDVIAGRFSVAVPESTYSEFRTVLKREQQGLCLFRDLHWLSRLKEAGYRLGLLSNVWPFPVRKLLDTHGMTGVFEHLILSCEVGHAKPKREIFYASAERFEVHPNECLMVGDNPDLDIRGALNAGMAAVHIDRYGDCKDFVPGVPVIGELEELCIAPQKP
ncbi:MAG: HAD-IA family hydrolase [Candidatus Obscuribacterales bacterium]|nr:HAD-IA family hydrolase [Candidatus Obscuribacterales bacterium]